MSSIEAGTILVKREVGYSDALGRAKTVPAGSHQIVPVEMKDMMDLEVELESWIIRESEGTERGIDHVVDCYAVEQWVADGDVELT